LVVICALCLAFPDAGHVDSEMRLRPVSDVEPYVTNTSISDTRIHTHTHKHALHTALMVMF